jgi:hypothetical protein
MGRIEHPLVDGGRSSTPFDLRPSPATTAYKKLRMFQSIVKKTWAGKRGVTSADVLRGESDEGVTMRPISALFALLAAVCPDSDCKNLASYAGVAPFRTRRIDQ